VSGLKLVEVNICVPIACLEFPSLYSPSTHSFPAGLLSMDILCFNPCQSCPHVPNMRVGCCLGPEGNGVSSGEGLGGEGGPGPPSRKEDKQSTPNKEGGNMEQEEEERVGWA
jgi:hypothetical protein